MKAIVLSRVSTSIQDVESQTIKVKQQAMSDGYSKNDIIIIEDIESAVKLSEEERNGLNKMKHYIESDSSINCVYTYEISRISRQAKIVFSIRDYLIKHNVQLVVMNPFFKMLNDDGTLSETSNIFFGIFASMAENEGYLRKARIKKAVEKYRGMGLHTGGNIMLGYTTNKNHEYIIDEKGSDIVRTVFRLYVEKGMSIRQIARELLERGISMTTTDKEKTQTSYHTLMTNINNILHRKEYYGAVNGKPAIISKEKWEQAQEIMKNREICKTRKEVPALLRGMMKDKKTGYILSANYTTKAYYSKRMGGASVNMECADNIIWEWAKKYYEGYSGREQDRIMKTLEHDLNVVKNKMLINQAMIDENKRKRDRLEERIVIGKISATRARELEQTIEREAEELESTRSDLMRIRNKIDEQMQRYDNDIIVISDNMDIEAKQKILRNIIEAIYIERITRTEAKLYIQTRDSDDMVVLRIDTYHKKLM